MNDEQQFNQLLIAYGNRDLTHEEQIRLLRLADADEGRTQVVAETQFLHDLFGAERNLMRSSMLPVEPAEESDEGYRRIARAAARQEVELRAELHGRSMLRPSPSVATDIRTAQIGTARISTAGGEAELHLVENDANARRRPLVGWIVAAAAVLLIATGVVVAAQWFGGAPDLSHGPVAPGVAGPSSVGPSRGVSTRGALPQGVAPAGQPQAGRGNPVVLGETIYITVKVTADSPEVSWHDVVGARGYEAVIEDEQGREIVRRSDAARGSTLWKLTHEDYRLLERQPSKLFLRIVARDGLGLVIASSRDRALQLR